MNGEPAAAQGDATPQGRAAPQPESSGPLYAEIERISKRLQSMKCALEPPKNASQLRRCATAPSVTKRSFGEGDVTAIITRLRALAESSSPTDRSQVNELLSWAEITVANHFRSLPWTQIDPARRSVEAAQRAAADDPRSARAASLYGLILLGLNTHLFRTQAEQAMGVATAPELRSLAPRLAEHPGDLKAQMVLARALQALERDGPLEPALASLRKGLDQRIATLRSRDRVLTEDVDEDFAFVGAQSARTE